MIAQGRNEIDRLLADSLKELVVKRPVEKITIKEITDRAGVIRPTFYNHFQDKFELIEWIINSDLLEPIQPLLHIGMISEAMVLLFSTNRNESISVFMVITRMKLLMRRLLHLTSVQIASKLLSNRNTLLTTSMWWKIFRSVVRWTSRNMALSRMR